MNQKKAKLIRKIANKLNLPYQQVKRNYKNLSNQQRDEMTKELRQLKAEALIK